MESFGLDWLKPCGGNKHFYEKLEHFLGLSLSAFKQSLSLQIVNDGVVYINQKLTIVAV